MIGDTELRIERVIDAPLDAVWRAWTEHGEEWFCPRPWQAKIVEQQLQPGGRSLIDMHGPDGEHHSHEGVILEVVPHARIVSTDALTADWQPRQPFMIRIDEFADAGDRRTRYTATARHWTVEARDQHETMGFQQGWGAAADQLADVAKRLAAGE